MLIKAIIQENTQKIITEKSRLFREANSWGENYNNLQKRFPKKEKNIYKLPSFDSISKAVCHSNVFN